MLELAAMKIVGRKVSAGILLLLILTNLRFVAIVQQLGYSGFSMLV